MYSIPASAVPGDEHWSQQFGPSGVTNIVFALGADENRLCVGGLNPAGGASNSVIHAWDGSDWSSLTEVSGNSKFVQDFAKLGADLYVGGSFSRIQGVPASGLGRWDGTSWYSVGGFVGTVARLVASGADMFVGGIFTNVGGQAITNIARWDGAAWHRLGDGLGPYSQSGSIYVYDILPGPNDVYAAGSFQSSGASTVRYLARWNGSVWSEVGGGINGAARALCRDGTDVYVAGSFTVAGGSTVNGIAKWNGSEWSALGSGMDGAVEAIAFYGGHLYAVGDFTTAGGVPAARIARWDGTSWSAIGSGLSAAASKLLVHQSKLYVGGNYALADGLMVNGVGCWDGIRWSGLGPSDRMAGVSSTVRAFARDGNNLYVGGEFTSAGNARANRIARWDGRNWSALGEGIQGGANAQINAIAISGTNVFAGGVFTNAGGVAANNIARWNGSQWLALDTGIPGTVSAIATRGNEIFVGGTFNKNVGSGTAFNIAKWDGAAWSVLPGAPWFGTISNFTVSALAVLGNDVYVGGNFVAGNPSDGLGTNIVRHDGSKWVPMGTGVNSNVNAVLVLGGNVYAAGRFTSASGVAAARIAKWDGVTWSAVGTGLSNTVNALAAIGTNLYAGGVFSGAGGMNASRVAKWDGIGWSPLGSGVYRSTGSGTVFALAAIGNDLFAGGTHQFGGTNRSYFVARWNDAIDFTNPRQITLGDAVRLASGRFRFTISASGVPAYVIEQSSDLTAWSPAHTNNISPFHYTNSETFPRRFYRVVGR